MHSIFSIKLKQTESIYADKLPEYKVEYTFLIFWCILYIIKIFVNFAAFLRNIVYTIVIFRLMQGITLVDLQSTLFTWFVGIPSWLNEIETVWWEIQ